MYTTSRLIFLPLQLAGYKPRITLTETLTRSRRFVTEDSIINSLFTVETSHQFSLENLFLVELLYESSPRLAGIDESRFHGEEKFNRSFTGGNRVVLGQDFFIKWIQRGQDLFAWQVREKRIGSSWLYLYVNEQWVRIAIDNCFPLTSCFTVRVRHFT